MWRPGKTKQRAARTKVPALPSLLALPGKASLLVLPGDGMFQAQRTVNGKCRPVILHGYGGAKKEMPTVPVAFSEARFQVKKSACFWRHGRYQE